jgi:anti-sigma factor ChrR (cupin superfamily)
MSDIASPDDDAGDFVLAALFTRGPAVTPPASVFAAIEASLDAASAKIDRKTDGIWALTAPGVLTKLLWDGRSLLIQCEIGAIIPEHEHYADERIIVISGDMDIGGESYGIGDTVWMPKGTHHGQTTTKNGCLILISYVN